MKPATVHASSLVAIRKVIIIKKRQTTDKNFFVVIKASEKADYGNIVDILDEMTIANVKRYALADISPEEKSYLK